MSDEEKKAKAEDAKPAKKPAAKKAAPKKDAAKKDAPKKAEAKKEAKPDAKAPAKKAKKEAEPIKKSGKLVEKTDWYDVLVSPVISEKSTIMAEENKVVFNINPTANKQDVKQAVEALFGVKVAKVNTIKTKGKVKRFRGRIGVRNDQRKAMVTLKEGQSIDIAAGIK